MASTVVPPVDEKKEDFHVLPSSHGGGPLGLGKYDKHTHLVSCMSNFRLISRVSSGLLIHN